MRARVVRARSGAVPVRVLVACEFSGVVRDAFRVRGHDAWSCDLLPSENPGQHIQGDVLPVLRERWDVVIAHPPCTYLSYAGMAYWNRPGRATLREEAMRFFLECYNANSGRVCVENPVGYPGKVFRKPDQIINPFLFGEPQRKRTCLWLRGLPLLWWAKEGELFPATAVEPAPPVYIDNTPRKKKRYFTDAAHGGHQRSRSFSSIADAMAEQWGKL